VRGCVRAGQHLAYRKSLDVFDPYVLLVCHRGAVRECVRVMKVSMCFVRVEVFSV
jgi:hypothetical protein